MWETLGRSWHLPAHTDEVPIGPWWQKLSEIHVLIFADCADTHELLCVQPCHPYLPAHTPGPFPMPYLDELHTQSDNHGRFFSGCLRQSCDETPWPNATCRGRGLSHLIAHLGYSRQAPEEKTEAEALESAAYWLAPRGVLSLLSTEPRTSCLGMALSTIGWAYSHQSVIKKVPYWLAYSIFILIYICSWGYSSQMTLDYVKLTQN